MRPWRIRLALVVATGLPWLGLALGVYLGPPFSTAREPNPTPVPKETAAPGTVEGKGLRISIVSLLPADHDLVVIDYAFEWLDQRGDGALVFELRGFMLDVEFLGADGRQLGEERHVEVVCPVFALRHAGRFDERISFVPPEGATSVSLGLSRAGLMTCPMRLPPRLLVAPMR